MEYDEYERRLSKIARRFVTLSQESAELNRQFSYWSDVAGCAGEYLGEFRSDDDDSEEGEGWLEGSEEDRAQIEGWIFEADEQAEALTERDNEIARELSALKGARAALERQFTGMVPATEQGVKTALREAGMPDELGIFVSQSTRREHQGVLVKVCHADATDLRYRVEEALVEAGMLYEAPPSELFVTRMPLRPSSGEWLSLLGPSSRSETGCG